MRRRRRRRRPRRARRPGRRRAALRLSRPGRSGARRRRARRRTRRAPGRRSTRGPARVRGRAPGWPRAAPWRSCRSRWPSPPAGWPAPSTAGAPSRSWRPAGTRRRRRCRPGADAAAPRTPACRRAGAAARRAPAGPAALPRHERDGLVGRGARAVPRSRRAGGRPRARRRRPVARRLAEVGAARSAALAPARCRAPGAAQARVRRAGGGVVARSAAGVAARRARARDDRPAGRARAGRGRARARHARSRRRGRSRAVAVGQRHLVDGRRDETRRPGRLLVSAAAGRRRAPRRGAGALPAGVRLGAGGRDRASAVVAAPAARAGRCATTFRAPALATTDRAWHALAAAAVEALRGRDALETLKTENVLAGRRPHARAAHWVYRHWLSFPDDTWPWLVDRRSVARVFAAHGVDAIVSTSPPPTAHLVAAAAARRLRRAVGRRLPRSLVAAIGVAPRLAARRRRGAARAAHAVAAPRTSSPCRRRSPTTCAACSAGRCRWCRTASIRPTARPPVARPAADRGRSLHAGPHRHADERIARSRAAVRRAGRARRPRRHRGRARSRCGSSAAISRSRGATARALAGAGPGHPLCRRGAARHGPRRAAAGDRARRARLARRRLRRRRADQGVRIPRRAAPDPGHRLARRARSPRCSPTPAAAARRRPPPRSRPRCVDWLPAWRRDGRVIASQRCRRPSRATSAGG